MVRIPFDNQVLPVTVTVRGVAEQHELPCCVRVHVTLSCVPNLDEKMCAAPVMVERCKHRNGGGTTRDVHVVFTEHVAVVEVEPDEVVVSHKLLKDCCARRCQHVHPTSCWRAVSFELMTVTGMAANSSTPDVSSKVQTFCERFGFEPGEMLAGGDVSTVVRATSSDGTDVAVKAATTGCCPPEVEVAWLSRCPVAPDLVAVDVDLQVFATVYVPFATRLRKFGRKVRLMGTIPVSRAFPVNSTLLPGSRPSLNM